MLNASEINYTKFISQFISKYQKGKMKIGIEEESKIYKYKKKKKTLYYLSGLENITRNKNERL